MEREERDSEVSDSDGDTTADTIIMEESQLNPEPVMPDVQVSIYWCRKQDKTNKMLISWAG